MFKPKEWKRKIRHENKNIAPDQKMISVLKEGKSSNRVIYNDFMRTPKLKLIKAQQKWNDTFPDEHLNWEYIYKYTTLQKSTNDIKLKNFQYKFLMRIIPTNQFLAKCQW